MCADNSTESLHTSKIVVEYNSDCQWESKESFDHKIITFSTHNVKKLMLSVEAKQFWFGGH